MDDSLRIVTFGRFAIALGAIDVSSAVAPSLRRLLAHLLLREGPCDRYLLAAELWPDETERVAAANLRKRLHELVRSFQKLGLEEPLKRAATTIELAPELVAASDVAAYRAAVAQELPRALTDYVEPVFPGVDDEWLTRTRNAMHERHVDVLSAALDAALRRGEPEAIYERTLALLAVDPMGEVGYRRAQAALQALGEGDRARRLFERYARALRDEAGIEAQAPERVTALLTLPPESSPFVKREAEVVAVCEALSSARLVTLVGPPGVGKSRIALQAAQRIAHGFGDSVRYIDISMHETWRSALAAIADLIRSNGSDIESIAQSLKMRDLLLVFDNVDALAAGIASLAGTIFRSTRRGAILVSTRKPLRIAGETLVTIAPLELPRESLSLGTDLLRSPAVAFFMDRAALAGAKIEPTQDRLMTVAEICRELDGLPLALELAARRVRTVGLTNVRTLLGKRFQLIDALGSAYEWSYERLAESDRRVFRMLGVFHGVWSLADVCELTSLPIDAAAQSVALLAEASLVTPSQDSETFTALRSTREFMRRLLERSQELGDAEECHAKLVIAPIVARGAELRGAHAEDAFDYTESRMLDIRAALESAIVRGRDVELGVRALAALSRFFFERGHALEARRWYDEALARLPEPSPLRAEARYLRALVGRSAATGAFNLADFESAIAELRAVGDRTTLAKALLYAANAARMVGRGTFALELAAEANEIVTVEHDRYLIGFSHAALGAAAYSLGDLEAAEKAFEIAGGIYREIDATNDEALMLVNAARCVLGRGGAAAALPAFCDALVMALSSGNRYVEAHARLSCALALLDDGDAARARPHIVRAVEIALGGADVELSIIALEALAELWVCERSYERAAAAMASADGVRDRSAIRRAPTERARCDRARQQAGEHAAASRASVRAPETAMRALLVSVIRQGDDGTSSVRLT
jgi:predicted ATPase/DNA-binding SARP family transcriptional activator